jgi:hypothetical protein
MKCSDCGHEMPLKVCHSAAGYYVGRWCGCGPYSRESEYFTTEESAGIALRAAAAGLVYLGTLE